MNNIQIFRNKELNINVRTMKNEDGSISINAEDTAIGFGWFDNSKFATSGEKYIRWNRVNKYAKESGFPITIGKGDYIPESLFYLLGMKANNEVARKFQTWLAVEVIPQIRKTGGYIPINDQMDDEEFMARALEVAHRTLKKKDELLKAKTEELEKKNRFINQIAVSENSLKVEEVAQLASKDGIKIGRNRLWAKLREWGLIKKNNKYDPKQKYIDNGYFEVVEGAKETSKGVFTYKVTKVTGKGQVYIINKLVEENKVEI